MRAAVALVLSLSTCACTAQPEGATFALPTPPFPEGFGTVPVNGRPVLFDDAHHGGDVAFVRRFEGGRVSPVPFVKLGQAPFEPDAYLLEPSELGAGEQLFVEALCDECGLAASWTVDAERDDVPLAIADGPAEVIEVTGFNYESLAVTHYSVRVQLSPLDGAGYYRFTGAGFDVIPLVPQQGLEDGTRSFVIPGGAARVECFSTVAVDVAGNETALPELCAELDPAVNASGCASAPGLPALAALFALLLRRRRAALLMLLAPAVARAEPVIVAPPRDPFPAVGSTIPTNARLVFFGEEQPDITFTRVETQSVLAFTTEPVDTASSFPQLMFVVDPGELVAGETVAIVASCTGCFDGQLEPFTFTVGDRDDDAPPSFVLGPVSEVQVGRAETVSCLGTSTYEGYGVSATVPPAVDDSGPLVIRIDTTEGDRAHERSSGAADEPIHVSFGAVDGPAREACATVTAIDVAGNEAQLAEQICADVGGGGCAQTSSNALVLAALTGLLARVRRRGR